MRDVYEFIDKWSQFGKVMSGDCTTSLDHCDSVIKRLNFERVESFGFYFFSLNEKYMTNTKLAPHGSC